MTLVDEWKKQADFAISVKNTLLKCIQTIQGLMEKLTTSNYFFSCVVRESYKREDMVFTDYIEEYFTIILYMKHSIDFLYDGVHVHKYQDGYYNQFKVPAEERVNSFGPSNSSKHYRLNFVSTDGFRYLIKMFSKRIKSNLATLKQHVRRDVRIHGISAPHLIFFHFFKGYDIRN